MEGHAMDVQKTIRRLELNHYKVKYFENSNVAADYLDDRFDNQVIGFGDSATMRVMQLYERMSEHNTVYDPQQSKDNDEFLEIATKCLTTDVYLTSANAIAETGEMVNIDGTGNRVAGSLFGHKQVVFVVSTNKIEPTLEKAIWRARNIASPKNCKKYDLNTPCVIKGDGCYDCNSPERICNAMVIYLKKMNDIDDVEIVLIDEEMGY